MLGHAASHVRIEIESNFVLLGYVLALCYHIVNQA